MNYYIADLHFGHANILKLCRRPFCSVQEMDETIIRNWNERVKGNDTVYILGDIAWDKSKAPAYLSRLKGKKVLIRGNHDSAWEEGAEAYFKGVYSYHEIFADGHPLSFCHYPMLEWRGSRKTGSKKLGYHIFGHIHNKTDAFYRPIFTAFHALNAGVDINGFRPVTFAELEENNEAFKLEALESPIDRAYLLASKYHALQFDKVGVPYIEHPLAVSARCEGVEAKTAALLHDILEDTPLPVSVLERHFSPAVVRAVKLLTHPEGEDYFDYVRRIGKDPLAREVKLADLSHNSDLSRFKTVSEWDLKRNEKYKKAMEILRKEFC